MHTEGKWDIQGGTNKKGDLFIWKSGEYYGGHAIATVHGEIEEGAEANAHRICQCVNNFDGLLDALKSVQRYNKSAKEGKINLDEAGDYWEVVMDEVTEAVAAAEKGE